MAQTPLQPNYMKVFIQRDYSEGEKGSIKIDKLKLCNWSQIFILQVLFLRWKLHYLSLLGCTVQFQCRFPQELEGRIDRATFERTITKINEYFLEAEKGNCSTFCEGFCACMTAYLIYLFSETHYEKVKYDFSLSWNFLNYWLTRFTVPEENFTLYRLSKWARFQSKRSINSRSCSTRAPCHRN